MPNFSTHHSAESVKMLLIADSGAGKTGSLSDLANHGYKLRILDFDNGLDVLKFFVDKDKLENINYHTLQDDIKFGTNGRPKIDNKGSLAFVDGMKLLNEWTQEDEDGNEIENLGRPQDWGSDTVLVIDSVTMMCESAMRSVLNMNARYGQTAQIQDWGEAIRLTEQVLALMMGFTKCHVIFTSHISYIGDEGNAKGYPSVLGQKLPPKVGRYFNTVIRLHTVGKGSKVQRVFRTISEGNIELKTPAPTIIPPEVPIEPENDGGLWRIFETIRTGEWPNDGA